MRTSEWVVVVYLAFLVAAAWVRRLPRWRRLFILLASAIVVAPVVVLAALPGVPTVEMARDWLPAIYLLAGFWLSGLFNQGTNRHMEAWLEEIDMALLRRLQALVGGWREWRAVSSTLEFAYLFCYPVVPGGIAALYLAGHREAADAYWTAVLAAAYLSYGTLPFFVTRPPRAIEGDREGSPYKRAARLRGVNLAILRHLSIQVNTLPSGHAAVAFAAAVALGRPMPLTGAAFGVVACAIAAGAFAGRYHFALDVVLGALLGALAGMATL